MFNIRLEFGRGIRPVEIGKAINKMNGHSLRSLTISGINDTGKAIEVNFMIAEKIAKGCTLFMGSRYTPTLVRTKR